MADHNDPNAVNSVFSDIDVSAADLYDIFGFPSDDRTFGEKVVIALTFAAAPETGIFDADNAGEIYCAAGNEIEGRNLRERALNLNPAVAGFHVHH